ncbi:MAG: phosphoglycerate kinase [Alphaproteobacteria bacterium]|nr:phosphoglycerate kinase [Alphaproteobacteria bacterium]
MKLRTLDNLDLRGKYVLLRDDFNVQILDGKITEGFRIERSMPTIEFLRSAGARVAIVSHLGRPKGTSDMKYSLRPVAEYMKLPFVVDCLNREFLAGMHDGDVVLLENVRFYAGEEENDPEFARMLANGFDLFVNDAFAVSHRAHASTVGITAHLPSYAGLLLQSEIDNITAAMENPRHPVLSIVAGSKVSTKIGVLRALARISDTLIVGGALGTTFNYALGAPVGNSLYEPDMAENAREIMKYAAENNCRLLVPLDKGVGPVFEPNAPRTDKDVADIKPDDVIIDGGPKTAERDVAEIGRAATVIWNGTVGMAEWMPTWSHGSFAIARAIAENTRAGRLHSIVGGGDTVAALDACGVMNDISYVSTGGGAFLEFIEGRELPGIKVLMD